MIGYIGIVHKDKGSDYGVSFPDFPGCITAGTTPEEAYAMAEEALQFHIEGMLEDGDKIPRPTSFENAKAKGLFADALLQFMINVRLPGKVKRVNIAMDENLLDDIDSVTRNRSAFLAEAAREKLSHTHKTA